MMETQQSSFWQSLRELKKSSMDKKIAGVCGGFERAHARAGMAMASFIPCFDFSVGSRADCLCRALDLYARRR
jgi:hypothetical protein